MAVAFESFSIREYTARMRKEDASKCWPFGGDGRERQLPPIECRKYRWWSSELQMARSADACGGRTGTACETPLSCASVTEVAAAVEVGEPSLPATEGQPVVAQQVDLVLSAQASPVRDGEEGAEDDRQTRSPGKAKMKTPKKRSIVELFAVAPQIETAEGEVEGDDDGEVVAAGGDSKEVAEDGELDRDAAEEPRKRKEESVETLMRKKIKRNCVKKKKANEEKLKKMMKEKKKRQKLLRKQKKQKKNVKIGIARKEKICKLSLQSPADFARLLHDSVIMRRFGQEIKIPVYAQRKKPVKARSAQKQNKMKAVQNFKLKKQLSEPKCFPIHSILKNQKTESSCGIGKVQVTDESQNGDLHHAQQLEKHVRFSGKDDILGDSEKHLSSLGSSKLQSLCKVFSDVLAASALVGRSPEGDKMSDSNNEAQEVIANKNSVADCAFNGKTGEHLLLQQLTELHDVINPAMADNPQGNHVKEKTVIGNCVDLNNSVQIHSDMNQIDPCSTTEPPKGNLKVMNSSKQEGYGSQAVDDTVEIDLSRTDTGVSLSESDAVVPLTTIIRNSNSELTTPLSVDVITNKSQLHPVIKPHMDAYTCDSQFQSPCLQKRGVVSTVYSNGPMKQLCQKDMGIRESRQVANPVTIFHDKHTSGNVIGLPLNSQGEYIQLQSNDPLGFDQLFKKQNMMLGPVGSFLVHKSIGPSSMDHLNLRYKVPQSSVYVENQQTWFPEKIYSRDQSIIMPLSGFSEHQGINHIEARSLESVKKYDQFLGHLNVEANLLGIPCYGSREQNQSHGHNDRAMGEADGASEPGFQSVTQPTMRLMGKNFIIYRNNEEHQGPTDSKIWSGKNIMTDLGPARRMSEETSPRQWLQPECATHPTSVISCEDLMHTLETQKKPCTSNFYHLTVDPRTDHVHHDYAPGFMPGNSCHSISYSHGLDPFSHPHAPEAWLGKRYMPKKNCGSGSESVIMGIQAPMAVCNSENVCQHLLLSSTHCRHSQSLSHSTTSTYPPSPAYPNPDHGNYAQHPLAQCSSQRLPHWLLDAGQHRTPNSSASSFSDSFAKHEPCTKSGNNIFPLPSPPLTSFMPSPSSAQNSHACFSDLPAPASLLHSSLIRSFPAAKSSSTNNACHWTTCNVRDDIKSKYSFIKSSDFANKARKRPAVDSSAFLKPMKRPNLCLQGDSRAPMGLKKGEQLHACTEHVSKMLELHDYGDLMVSVSDAAKDAHVNAYAASTSKSDTGSRSRPVKLSAGAKHILKPSLSMDRDNSVPTHSTIPFAHGTSSSKVPVSQKKPAKVYQF